MDVSSAGAALSPSLWRTCRALANRRRLRLFQHLLDAPDQTVSEAAARAGLRPSLTSQYLRMLNARGVIRATRDGVWVRYSVAPDPLLPEAALLVDALRREFAQPSGAIERVFSELTAFTHPRRIALVRLLHEAPDLDDAELRRRSGISADALARHLHKLARRGVVSEARGAWRLRPVKGALAKALVAIAGRKSA